MEEEVGIKVTRLRRRLSVESEDVKSPSTPLTPTKKRGGRLAAKPQLELIDENATETVPKRTRKAAVKEAAEPVEDKVVTPSRRSTRIRSNTSILSETPEVAEEKTADKGTPSRRSTRIKSNSSLIAETVNVNSPRAKRAARRTSLVGSDNEAPATPVRATRRTRKTSTSSVDNQAEPVAGKLGGQLNETITEETENNGKDTKPSASPNTDTTPVRKSPRLVGKTNRKTSLENEDKENEPQAEIPESDKNQSITDTETADDNSTEKNNLSVSTTNLINKIDEAPKKGKVNMNKSTTSIEEPTIKSKRNRTKSWSTISVERTNDHSFCSDSEASKKKIKEDKLNLSNMSGSGDGIMNTSNKGLETTLNTSVSNKKNKKRNEQSMSMDTETSVHEISLNSSKQLNKSKALETDTKEIAKNGIENSEKDTTNKEESITEKLFSQAPSGQASIFIEDSDSNTGSIGKENKEDQDGGDQCVPVVDHKLATEENNEPKNNMSYEPMDIDETMPENISVTTFTNQNTSAKQDKNPEKRKSVFNISEVNESLNKSKRKSNISVDSEIPNEDTNKSQRKSSVTSTSDSEDKDLHKSKRKSKISIDSEQVPNEDGNKSQKKSSITSTSDFDDVNKESNKSKRKSSISKIASDSEDIPDGSSNTSARKSSIEPINDISVDKKSKKSKRKSLSVMESEDNMENDAIKSKDIENNADTQDTVNKSSRKSSLNNLEVINESLNKSKKKSSISAMVAEISMDKRNGSISETGNDKNESLNSNSNKSKRKPSTSFTEAQALDNTDNENKSTLVLSQIKDTTENDIDMDSNKSKNKSAILKSANNTMDSKLNKSKRKSSISFTEAQQLDKTDNENKSTLVLSQIKDASNNEIDLETNVPKTNDANEQLSKSVDVPNVAKESDKKNLSVTYSTSTPLQQKSLKKLGLQINSSIITPNNTKVEKKKTPNKSPKEASILSQKDSSDSSEEESDDEEESMDNSNKLVIDEAEEASEDYESGDSMDEDEREYAEQNEIVEKGETLDSEEEDYSDDSDYEKDSFIVSSDNEDEELLSGSGDDLSMSDNELSMSNKSKKKFNERKLKEQKKASREMFEARHKLNETDKKAKSKKNKKQRLESSSDSNEEVAQPKKTNRQRIDSSQDISNIQSEPDDSIIKKKKKKVKRLSESVCENEDVNEKEITIVEETQSDKVDPLNLKDVVKVEPKTPQKDMDISTVAIPSNMEEVIVEENVSIMKSSQTSDPLQVTTIQDEEDYSDEGSISENEEITQNYESLLNDLNKSVSKKIKMADISLNLDKKSKKSAEPIVDQLNLTDIKDKKSKKNKKNASEEIKTESKKNKADNNKIVDEGDGNQMDQMSESSSDSIDMKLLFPEDSNDSEGVPTEANESKKYEEKSISQDEAESFIPLKRTEGKTNMLESTDTANTSLKEKKIKRKSKDVDKSQTMEDQLFFVDTTGDLREEAKVPDANTSIKSSAKKNKQKNNVSFANTDEVIGDDDSNDAPLEVSYRSEKNKSKQDINASQSNLGVEPDKDTETPSQSKKKNNKKNKKNLNNSLNVLDKSTVEDTDDVKEKSINISTSNIVGSGKKKKKISESQINLETEPDVPVESTQNVSISSAKKKKTVSESSAAEKESVVKDDKNVVNNEGVSNKRKRKSSGNQTVDELVIEDDIKPIASPAIIQSVLTTNQKKKRKISQNDQDNQIQVTIVETQEKVSVKSVKKKNKPPQVQEVNEINEEHTKKNKKRKEREDDDASKMSKVLKQNSFDKIHVPRLPENLLNQLDNKPNLVTAQPNKKSVVSTTSFVVEETRKRRTKPSNYLEESVYLNDDVEEDKPKSSLKKPKVLPFVPTASTSDKGFTTKFTVNIIPREIQFIAQSTATSNFKNDYLQKNRIKKLGTFEIYKRQRKTKISKF